MCVFLYVLISVDLPTVFVLRHVTSRHGAMRSGDGGAPRQVSVLLLAAGIIDRQGTWARDRYSDAGGGVRQVGKGRRLGAG